jgi:hypothetical protein
MITMIVITVIPIPNLDPLLRIKLLLMIDQSIPKLT